MHTPGPWYEAKTGNHQGLIVSEANGANVAVTYDKADALLIAAAPELLDEAMKLVTNLSCMAIHESHTEPLLAVIKKATGAA